MDERDELRRRVSELEERLERHRSLENERAETRRLATEALAETVHALEAERDAWQRRAVLAEARNETGPRTDDRDSAAATRIDELEREVRALSAERDESQERARHAEEVLKRSAIPAASRRRPPRGNWLR